MHERIELRMSEKDGQVVLESPEVGHFTQALAQGALVSPGAVAGTLTKLGRSYALVVPAGVFGRVANAAPERLQQPVSWGDTLYELAKLEGGGEANAQTDGTADKGTALAIRAPYSGRFWHRPAPQEPAFAKEGDVVEAGVTVGLIEVMKTFTHLAYKAESGLPARAKITRVVAHDGEEIEEGSALFEVAPA